MTETYLAMVKLKLGIQGIIQESKRLHKIKANLDSNRNVTIFRYEVNQSAHPLNLSNSTIIKARIVSTCRKTISKTTRRPMPSGKLNLKLFKKLAQFLPF